MATKTVVTTVSVGDRPWFGITTRWAEYFCEKWDYDLKIFNDVTIEESINLPFDRFQNFGRFQKLGIGGLFENYDRVIQIDDTCIISPRIPNVVDIVPRKYIGCVVTGKFKINNEEFRKYLEFHKTIYGRDEIMAHERFYNSGFSVYSYDHKSLFDKKAIPFEIIVRDTKSPGQGYLSHSADINNIPLFDLGIKFNFVGSMIRNHGLNEDNIRNIYVFHLTSALKQHERYEYAQKLDEGFTKMVRSGG